MFGQVGEWYGLKLDFVWFFQMCEEYFFVIKDYGFDIVGMFDFEVDVVGIGNNIVCIDVQFFVCCQFFFY